jgi:hypothetical protein
VHDDNSRSSRRQASSSQSGECESALRGNAIGLLELEIPCRINRPTGQGSRLSRSIFLFCQRLQWAKSQKRCSATKVSKNNMADLSATSLLGTSPLIPAVRLLESLTGKFSPSLCPHVWQTIWLDLQILSVGTLKGYAKHHNNSPSLLEMLMYRNCTAKYLTFCEGYRLPRAFSQRSSSAHCESLALEF